MRPLLPLLLCCSIAPAAESPVARLPSYSLAEAMAYAAQHQPRIRSALAEVRARLSEARIPRGLWYPQIGATAQILAGSTNQTTAQYLGVARVDLARIGATKPTTSTDWTPAASTLAALTIDQEVYDFGRIAALSAVADALADLARAGSQSVTLDVQMAVEQAYHAVLAAHEVLTATGAAYQRAVTHRDYAQSATKSGMRPPIELTRAQADVAQLDVRRMRAEAGLKATRAALAAAIGSEALEVDASEHIDNQSPSPSLDEAVRLAQQKNPLMAMALARVRANEQVVRVAARELAPNVFASATLSGRAGGATPTSGDIPYGDGWLPDVGNWHIGLVLQWNIFDMTSVRRKEAAKARVEAANADLQEARAVVTLAAQRAVVELNFALRALPALQEAVRAAQANSAQAEARFKAGLGTSLELADAEQLLTSAELELAVGRFSIARARGALARAVGHDVMRVNQGGTP